LFRLEAKLLLGLDCHVRILENSGI
jgi:hypothetical protein